MILSFGHDGHLHSISSPSHYDDVIDSACTVCTFGGTLWKALWEGYSNRWKNKAQCSMESPRESKGIK